MPRSRHFFTNHSMHAKRSGMRGSAYIEPILRDCHRMLGDSDDARWVVFAEDDVEGRRRLLRQTRQRRRNLCTGGLIPGEKSRARFIELEAEPQGRGIQVEKMSDKPVGADNRRI